MSQPSETSPDSQPPRRRWFQFSLRALLIFVTLTACSAFAWRAYVEPYRRQRQTMVLIERLGGSYQTTEAPGWLRRWSGDTFQKVVLVNLIDCRDPTACLDAVGALPAIEMLVVGLPGFTDQHLQRWHGLKTLRGLVLDCTDVTDEGLSAARKALPLTDVYPSQRWVILQWRAFGCVKTQLSTNHSGIQRSLGDEWLDEAVELDLEKAPFTVEDAELLHVSRLSRLERLNLRNTWVGDAGLEHLISLRTMPALDLWGTKVSDAGLVHLAHHEQLQILSLAGTQVGDIGLAHLRALQQLESLDLQNTKVTDDGLASLQGLTKLRRLDLEVTDIGDPGLAQLQDLRQIETLSLARTRVGDAGLAQLKTFHQLARLNLADTQVTDAGLAHLRHLGHLRVLSLAGTKVTAAAVSQLSSALPKCSITRLREVESPPSEESWPEEDGTPKTPPQGDGNSAPPRRGPA